MVSRIACAKSPRSLVSPAGPNRPRLLFISPMVPSSTGTGLAMRAGAVLRALAERYAVSLLVVPLYQQVVGQVPPEYADRCERAVIASSPPGPESAFAADAFELVHVFRLALLPAAQAYFFRAASRHLDLDDLESESFRRIAALHRLNGDEVGAASWISRAERSASLERQALDDFDRLYVCSEQDRTALVGRGRAEICVLPNVVPVHGPLPPPPDGDPFTFLFVGTLGYYPNEDAARWLCGAVLAELRRLASRPYRLAIVGDWAPESVRALASLAEVEIVGRVADLEPWYRRAGAVVVPIRAGGGTRIKVLEAFAYRRAVVSTTVGFEGIDARADEHLLVADDPASFAAQCIRLMDDRQLAERLTEAACDRVARAYSPRALAERVAALA